MYRTPDVVAAIREASARFDVPTDWIERIVQVESAGRVRARSRAGAIGLMQVMPETYADLRLRHRLGADPWVPRDNILAGAAFLRELFDRYGAPGFLAAYNAGPKRWEQHLAGTRSLPAETTRYLARLGFPAPGLDRSLPIDTRSIAARRPEQNTLFVQLSADRATKDESNRPPRDDGHLQVERPVAGLFPARSVPDAAQ